jgi:Gpi18-like mannosyltransferase
VEARAGGGGWAARQWRRLAHGGERGVLARWALLLFAVNKVLVVAATLALNRSHIVHDTPRGLLRWLFVENFHFWDANWYIQIARYGYAYDPKSTTFFPLFPQTMAVVTRVTHLTLMASGVLIANVCFLGVLYTFLRLTRVDHDLRDTKRIGWLLALYPTSFYFSAAYTESMFMLWTILVLLALRRKRWARAGLYGFLAGLTRNTGALLVLPFLIELATDIAERRPTWKQWLRRESYRLLWVGAVGASGVAYAAYLWHRFGDPLLFAHNQVRYGRTFMVPWKTLYGGYKFIARNLWHNGLGTGWPRYYYPIQLWFVTWVLVVLVTGFRKMRWSYWVIVLYSLVVPLSSPARFSVADYFVSFSRYSLVIVPLYYGMYRLLGRSRVAYGVHLAVSVVLLLVLAAAWSKHLWVA